MFSNVPAKYLLELGFFPQHSGFGYLVYAIRMISADPLGYYSGKIDVYAALKSEYGVSESCAKRCMYYSLQTAWQTSYNSRLHSIFPSYSKNYPPSLSEFICRAAIEISGETDVGSDRSA
ncbi:MAG: hypothetical protein IKS90_07050 [Clostridia bacterium]|nr:hypothetical protein [Clostridia bacterium]